MAGMFPSAAPLNCRSVFSHAWYLALGGSLALAACRTDASTAVTEPGVLPAGSPAVLVGAGDIAVCGASNDEATARLLDAIEGTVFTAGDNAYSGGTAQEFADCYAPSWGRHKSRTRPSPGNHDYKTPFAAGYYEYFGAAAGEPGKGYYSYDVGTWHIVALNSNIDIDVASPQLLWLVADLQASQAACTLAYWHHARFSSGHHGNDNDLASVWEVLYEIGAEVVINGHDHNYERFAPQSPDGEADFAHGIREFVVGTGGRALRDLGEVADNSEVRDDETFGVLKLTLGDGTYTWEFVATTGSTFTDSGTGTCH